MKEILKRDYFLILLSFFIAVVLWGFATEVKNPETVVEIKGIPVDLIETGYGPSSAGMVILKGNDQTVDIKLRGFRRALTSLSAKDVTATANISGIVQAGNYDVTIDIKVNAPSVNVTYTTPKTVNVIVDKIVTIDIPVKVSLSGTSPANIAKDNISTTPQTIRITGPQIDLNYISHASATVDVTDVNKTFNTNTTIKLINKSGDVVNNKYITTQTANVDVTVPLLPTKTVPLKASYRGVFPDNVSFLSDSVLPDKITIAAEKHVLDLIQNIYLQEIDVSTINQNQTFEQDIKFPANVINMSNITKSVVNVEVETFTSKEIVANKIEFINLHPQNSATVQDFMKTVTLYGPPSLLESITAEDVYGVIDFKSVFFEAGTYPMIASFIVKDNSIISISDTQVMDVNIFVRTGE